MRDPIDLSPLENLAPEARARVESALKRTLDAELARAASGIPGAEAMAHSRSKGFFFSRSKTSDVLRPQMEIDRTLLQNIQGMDDAAFSRFAERLTRLRQIGGGGGS